MMGLYDNEDANSLSGNAADFKGFVDAPIVFRQLKMAVEDLSKEADPQSKRMEIASELLDHICMLVFFFPLLLPG